MDAHIFPSMPPLPLAAALYHEFPGITRRTRAILTALAASGGDVGSVDHLAALAAFRNRFQLARWVRREGLPSVGDLMAWARVLHWSAQAEATGFPLSRLALRSGIAPATAYRIVKRISRTSWTVLRRMGFSHAVMLFGKSCQKRGACGLGEAQLRWRPGKVSDSSQGREWMVTPLGSCTGCSSRPSAHASRSQVLATIPVPGQPYDVACWSTNRAYVTCGHHGVIRTLDLNRLAQIGTVRVGSVPTRVIIGPGGRTAYVSNQFDRSVTIIDIPLQRQIGEFPVGGDPVPLLVDPRHHVLHVATNEDCLFAIDMRSGKPVDAIALPATSHHLAFHPDGRRLYVATRAAGVVLEIAVGPYVLLRRWAVGGRPQAMAVRSDGSRLFVANESFGVNVIDLVSGQVRWRLDAGHQGCFGMALSPSQRELYVASTPEGVLRVADTDTARWIGIIPVGGSPREMTFDPSGRVLVVTNEAGWVDIVRPLTYPDPSGPTRRRASEGWRAADRESIGWGPRARGP